jgi:hypothetical protein
MVVKNIPLGDFLKLIGGVFKLPSKFVSMKAQKKIEKELVELFERNGCLRMPKEERMEEGHQLYKKGCEIRWVAYDEMEAREITVLLGKAGFKVGSAFIKNNRVVLPVYGYEALARFQVMLKEVLEIKD